MQQIALQKSQFMLEEEILYFIGDERGHQKRVVVPHHQCQVVFNENDGGLFGRHSLRSSVINILVRHW